MIHPKEPPYTGTVVAPERTLSQIQQLLLDYGCEAVQVTRDSMGRVEIQFAVEVEVQGVRRKVAVRVEPPLLAVTRGRGYNKVTTADPARSYRLLYWYLKSKLEAISYGLVSAEKEFFAQVLVALPGGGSTTIGDMAEESIVKGGSMFLPGISLEKRPQLPEPKPAERES
jgi:hypothetical protein